MNLMPVITRELRVQARQPFTYRLRLLGVLALLATCGWFLVENSSDNDVGGALFATLHGTLFYATLVLVTFSAVDSLSRERREGTLGLLLLTPLGVVDVVIAKLVAHGLRAATLLLASIPVFALPMLLGGVAWPQMVETLLLIGSAICLALGAAILASAWFKTWVRALVTAIFLVIASWLCFTISLGLMLHPYVARANSNFSFEGSFDFLWLRGLAIASGGLSVVDWGLGAGNSAPTQSLWVLAQVAGLALVWLLAAIFFAARRIRNVWREEPPSARRQWVEQKLATPVVGLNYYRAWMRRMLERNPVGWLQRRAWQGRIVMWTWLAIVITVTTSALGDSTLIRTFSSLQRLLAWLLVLSIAGTVAGSFRRERETGMMELLLISSFSARRIIAGRLMGLWGQFLPAVSLFIATWAYISRFVRDDEAYPDILWFLLMFVTLPIIGLYFSLRCRSFVAAFLSAVTLGVAVPMVCSQIVLFTWALFGPERDDHFLRIKSWKGVFLVHCWIQLGVAAICWLLTNSRLERRQFTFERSLA